MIERREGSRGGRGWRYREGVIERREGSREGGRDEGGREG